MDKSKRPYLVAAGLVLTVICLACLFGGGGCVQDDQPASATKKYTDDDVRQIRSMEREEGKQDAALDHNK